MIRRGEDWGSVEPVPEGAPAIGDNAALHAFLSLNQIDSLGPVVLTGGDLARTVGVPESATAPAAGTDAAHVALDLGVAEVNGEQHLFGAHCVVRKRWWNGRVLVISNGAFVGRWNVGPKAHPGDGRVDVMDANLSLNNKAKAWRRLPSGTHVPHPDIATRQIRHGNFEFETPMGLWLDGTFIGAVRQLAITVEPGSLDAWLGS